MSFSFISAIMTSKKIAFLHNSQIMPVLFILCACVNSLADPQGGSQSQQYFNYNYNNNNYQSPLNNVDSNYRNDPYSPTSNQYNSIQQNLPQQQQPQYNSIQQSLPQQQQQYNSDSTYRNNQQDPNYNTNSNQYNQNAYGGTQYNQGSYTTSNQNPNYPSPAYNNPSQPSPAPYNPNINGNSPQYDQSQFVNGQDIPQPQLEGFLAQVDAVASQECSANVAAQWEYETNVNEATQIQALSAQQKYAGFQREVWEALKRIDLSRVADPRFVRELRFLSAIGSAALPPDQYDRYNRLISEMVAVYDQASICAHNEPFRCGLRLNPDLTVIMARSRDWDELQHTWLEWRRHTGKYIRDIYDQLVDLTNQAARLNNFTDGSEMWTFPYETATFPFEMEEVWTQVNPLFQQLHAYVRRKLRDLYGPERVSKTSPMPSHILGNMWAQSWTNILDITIPYPGKNFLDTTPNMQAQGYTQLTMLQLAEEFYVSMNMSVLPPEFLSGSIIVDPGNRIINCQASAWDFCNGRDYRLKMCANINMKDFSTMHHELAHIQYFLQYRNLPKVYRDGANPGFHEAIGEAIALSANSPQHLQTLGLVQTSINDLPLEINYLFGIAMDKLPFLAFSLSMDKWRWDVFRRKISKEQFNCHWHSLREQYLGVKPPLLRSEIDFDPGSKYHIPANIPYIRYYFGTVLQFQLHRHLCTVAGQYDPNDLSKPLHRCDIYRSKEAGEVLKEIMKYGSSVPWQELLYRVTGQDRLDGSAIRDFFRPLEDWLRNENLRTQEYPGWIYDGDYCKASIETAGLFVRGGYYNSATIASTSFLIIICTLVFFVLY